MKNLKKKAYEIAKRIFMSFYRKTHKIKNKIIFSSFSGKQYSDSPRAISEKMHELYPEYELIWLLKSDNEKYDIIPNYIKIDRPRTIKWLTDCATAACFVSNNSNMMGFLKGKDQIIVRTWHGDRGMKLIMNEKVSDPSNMINTDNVDLFVAGSDYGIKRISTAFAYHGEIVCEGMPRNDCLININEQKKKAIKHSLGISDDIYVLLYAPTFRDNLNEKQENEVDLYAVQQHLEQRGGNWLCLIRSHFYSKGIEGLESFRDVTDYPDMADILLITDILITDYSSSSGDFILTNKPVILVHYDLEKYNNTYRKLHFNPTEAGYLTAKDNKELLDLIDEMTEEMAVKECETLKKFFGVRESGQSAECVCNRIDELILDRQRNNKYKETDA